MERKCQQSCCKNAKNKSNFWLKFKDMLQINPEKRYLTPQLMFLPPSMWSIPKTLPIFFLSFSVWQRNDGYYLPKWLTAINNDAAAVFFPLQDWGVRVCSGSPESVCDETCFEVRGDAVGAAARPHLLPLMELSQPICLRCSLRDRMHFKYEICSTLRRWPQLLHDHVWSSSHVTSFSGPQRLLALK